MLLASVLSSFNPAPQMGGETRRGEYEGGVGAAEPAVLVGFRAEDEQEGKQQSESDRSCSHTQGRTEHAL